MSCPTCDSLNNKKREDLGLQIFECKICGCIHGTEYLGKSYGIVRNGWATDPEADKRAIPFDLICLGSKGVTRRHGWFDPESRLITQTG